MAATRGEQWNSPQAHPSMVATSCCRRGIAHDECGDPSLGAAQRLLLLVLHTIGEDLDPGRLPRKISNRCCLAGNGSLDQHHVGPQGKNAPKDIAGDRPGSHQQHTAIGRQQARETFLIQADVGQHHHPYRRFSRRGFVRGLGHMDLLTAIEQVHEWRTASVKSIRAFS